MTRRKLIRNLAFAVFGAALLLPSVAAADMVPGEVWVTLKGNDYAKPFLEGEEYEDHEFRKNGTLLVIRLDDIATPYEFEIHPSLDTFEKVRISTADKKFRAKRVRGSRARRMVWATKLTFKKKAPKAPAPPKK